MTVILSPTAALIAGNTSSEAGAWSSWRPPWFDTMIPSHADIGGAHRVGRAHDPLDDQLAREQPAVIFEVRQVCALRRHLRAVELDGLLGVGAGAGIGQPVLQHRRAAACLIYSTTQPGCVIASARIDGFRLSAARIQLPRILAKPLRMLRSRFECTGTSTVSTSASSPAIGGAADHVLA